MPPPCRDDNNPFEANICFASLNVGLDTSSLSAKILSEGSCTPTCKAPSAIMSSNCLETISAIVVFPLITIMVSPVNNLHSTLFNTLIYSYLIGLKKNI